MSSGSVTGSSGQKFIYYLIVIGAAGGGGLYAYKTVTSDNARYKKRLDNMQQRSTAEWKPKSWPPQSLENDEIEAKEATGEREEAVKEETEAITADESEVQNERHTEPTEAQREELPVEKVSSGVQEEEQDALSSSEAAQTQGRWGVGGFSDFVIQGMRI
ncbi:protein MGARP isoform X2 [Rhineura floridana]|nr:protein MGARP isoform X2 [Rhineura floridana]XP_061440933.1 protein MGARP isoform X2 [Rhineura floridana]XP_061440934.1 protein MGARP isoform X2 [Rhineura floridana]XP_061440935.1 protein MGARP isoform X2 [Rhineura floridana]